MNSSRDNSNTKTSMPSASSEALPLPPLPPPFSGRSALSPRETRRACHRGAAWPDQPVCCPRKNSSESPNESDKSIIYSHNFCYAESDTAKITASICSQRSSIPGDYGHDSTSDDAHSLHSTRRLCPINTWLHLKQQHKYLPFLWLASSIQFRVSPSGDGVAPTDGGGAA